MPSTSSVPKIQFTPQGLVLPQESAILQGVQADIDAAFGGGVNPALETPQGQLASSQSAVIGDKNNEFAYYVNQIDPQYSSGRFQDAIARIYFLNRKPALPTVVECTVGGVSGTLIPAGTLAQDTNSNTYISVSDVTIGLAGTATVEFQNTVTGPIPCAPSTLIRVYQIIPGWDTITNAAEGITGSNVESSIEFEFRRKNSVEFNANGTPGAIYANVFNVDNVLDVYVTTNNTSAPVEKGSTDYELAPHSVYVAVVGGNDTDIANAIFQKIDIGCDFNGDTTVIVYDQSGYSFPYPDYEIKFNRPDALAIKFAVNIVDDPSLPSDIESQVKNAVLAQFTGSNGAARARIGSKIFASNYYGPVSILGNLSLINILVGTTSPTLTSVDVGIDQVPTLSAADIAVNLV